MAFNSLKEYLVNIGWKSDKVAFNRVMGDITKLRKNLLSLSVKSFAGISTLFTGAVSAIWNVVDGVAEADLSARRFARSMWTSVEAARSFQDASELTGLTWESLFYATGEEVKHFIELKNLSTAINTPPALNEGLKLIRSINYEVDKLKLILKQATRWIAYYFLQLNSRDITDLRNEFRKFNEWLINKIPIVTQKIAILFTFVLKLGKAFITLLKVGKRIIEDFFSAFDKRSVVTAGALGALFAVIKSGPIGWIIAALTTILLLIDDYATWARGGHSTLGIVWEQLDSLNDLLDTNIITLFGESVDGLIGIFIELAKAVADLVYQYVKWLDKIGLFDAIKDTFTKMLEDWTKRLQDIADIISLIKGDFSEISENGIVKKVFKIDDKEGIKGLNGNIGINPILQGLNRILSVSPNKPLGGLYDNFNKSIFNYLIRGKKAEYPPHRGGGFGGDTNSYSQQNNITIDVYGNADADNIADTVAGRINNYGLKFALK